MTRPRDSFDGLTAPHDTAPDDPAASLDEEGSKVTLPRWTGQGTTVRIALSPLAARDTELAPAAAGVSSRPPRPVDAAAEPVSLEDASRYAVTGLLGEGGMGEVRLCHDRRIGRDVAMKIAKSSEGSHPDLVARFLREVRVQGQLEHPGVVPVYDLAVDDDGRVVFTMKRVKGRTLEDVVFGLRDGDPSVVEAWPRRALLAAFSRACLTVAFAHSRGVVHRDLKPANVMVGDFGEVYVLDWGIARIASEAVDTAAGHEPVRDDPAVGRTEAGALLGTPGYMAPEQARGELDAIGPATDVYALGAVLFELLALEPLHAGHRTADLIVSTVRGVDGRPSARAHGEPVPPELDAICVRATALDPADRFGSARDLAQAIDRFLDGERDVERRRELAGEHLRAAREAVASGDGASTAMRELAQALALDPTHQEALAALRGMVLDAPDALPPRAEEELARINVKDRARASTAIALSMILFAVIAVPLVLWMGIRVRWLVPVLFALVLGQSAYAGWMGWTGRAEPRFMRYFIVYAFLANATIATQFGPFILTPILAAATAAMFLVSLRPNAMTRRMIFSLSVWAVAVPIVLDGWVVPWTVYEGDAIRILPFLTDFPALPTRVALAVGSLGLVVSTNVMIGQAAARIVDLERRIFGQAWRLRQILPEEVASTPPSTRGRGRNGDGAGDAADPASRSCRLRADEQGDPAQG